MYSGVEDEYTYDIRVKYVTNWRKTVLLQDYERNPECQRQLLHQWKLPSQRWLL